MIDDLTIAQAAKLLPISKIAENIGVPEIALVPFGDDKAKISLDFLANLEKKPLRLRLCHILLGGESHYPVRRGHK